MPSQQINAENPFAHEPVLFYTDSKLVERALKSNTRFSLVETMQEADIIWMHEEMPSQVKDIFP